MRNDFNLQIDEAFMKLALAEAQKAAKAEETPIGAVVVVDGRVIAAAHNTREHSHDITAHAELLAVRAAAKEKGDWRLNDCTVYVTLEPCPMCAGALLASRVSRVVYGAKDPAAGAMGTVINLPRYPLGSSPAVTAGVLEEECRTVLQDFFKNCRK
ncbi:MAG: nucleoside deaminase [Ruminococcaceae bacterium]|nr:nucleoside deaminase [Oscillospiraceae bacterium]